MKLYLQINKKQVMAHENLSNTNTANVKVYTQYFNKKN